MQNTQEANQMTEGQKSQTARTASRGLEPRCVPVSVYSQYLLAMIICRLGGVPPTSFRRSSRAGEISTTEKRTGQIAK